jgi:prepilin-type N-terminal cleavage/methylation domain-containing protein
MVSRWYFRMRYAMQMGMHAGMLAMLLGAPSALVSAADQVQPNLGTIDGGPMAPPHDDFLYGPEVKPQTVDTSMRATMNGRPQWLVDSSPSVISEYQVPAPLAQRSGSAIASATILAATTVASSAPVHAATGSSWSMPFLILVVIALCVALWYTGRKPRSDARAALPMTVNLTGKIKGARIAPRRAFSILEVMIAVSILSVALMGMLSGISTLSVADRSAKETTVIRQAAQNLCEHLQGASWHLLGIPSEPWSWYRRATYPAGTPFNTDPLTYWKLWNPLTVPNAWPGVFPTNQHTYFNPPITLSGSGARSIFINKGVVLVDSNNHPILGPTGLQIPIQQIIVVDCALENPPPAVVTAARSQWASDPAYTAVTPVVGLGIFHDVPPLVNLRIYVEYFNQFPASGLGNSIFLNPTTAPSPYTGLPVCSRQQFLANITQDNYRLAVPNPANPVNLYYLESPDDFSSVGIDTVSTAVGIRVLFSWDSCSDTPPNIPIALRPGTRTQQIILERRQ